MLKIQDMHMMQKNNFMVWKFVDSICISFYTHHDFSVQMFAIFILFLIWRNIPSSIPFNEFGIALEYGGPNKSSTLLSLAPKLDGFPPLHFLYVKVDIEDSVIALVEDNPIDQDLKATLVSGDYQSFLHTLVVRSSLVMMLQTYCCFSFTSVLPLILG